MPEGIRLAGGATTLRLAQIHDMLLLRELGPRPSSYNTCGLKLLDWVVSSRLLELSGAQHDYNFQFFEVAYFTDWASFVNLTQDLGFELENEEWVQHKENVAHRLLLFKALWDRQWEGLTVDVESLPPLILAEQVVTVVPPSHPGGWGMGQLSDMGRFRLSRDRHLAGTRVEELPDYASATISRVLFRISSASREAAVPGWPMLPPGTSKTLASATLAGVQENTPLNSALLLEGFELPLPHRRFTVTLEQVRTLETVRDASEAWAAHRADPDKTLFLADLPSISEQGQGAWPVSAIDSEGNSLLAGEVFQGARKPDFSEILELAGTSASAPEAEKRLALAEVLCQMSTSAHANQVQQGKGLAHGKVKQVRVEALGAFSDATTGIQLSKAATTEERYEAAEGFKKPADMVGGVKAADCLTRPWCLSCNSLNIIKASAGHVTKSQLTAGEPIVYDDQMRQAIICLPVGAKFCSAVHLRDKVDREGRRSGTQTAMRALPPLGIATPCPRSGCNKWIRPNPDSPTFNCECGQAFGVAASETELVKPLKEKTKLAYERESRFQLLGMAEGKYALEEDGRLVVRTLADAQRGLNELREKPYNFKSIHIGIEITPRVIAYGPLWQAARDGRGLVLLDGQLPESDIAKGLPQFAEEMEDIYKAAEAAEEPSFNRLAPPEPENDEDRAGHRALILYLIDCYERLLGLFGYCNKRAHLAHVAPAVEALRLEFASARGRQWHWRTVAQALQCLLEDNDQRYRDAVRFPDINQLTHAEREAGGVLTFLPFLGCSTMLREIWVAQQEAQFAFTEKQMLRSLEDSNLRRDSLKKGQELQAKREKRQLQEIEKLKAQLADAQGRKGGGGGKAKGEPREDAGLSPEEQEAQAKCGYCLKRGHYARNCPDKAAGRPSAKKQKQDKGKAAGQEEGKGPGKAKGAKKVKFNPPPPRYTPSVDASSSSDTESEDECEDLCEGASPQEPRSKVCSPTAKGHPGVPEVEAIRASQEVGTGTEAEKHVRLSLFKQATEAVATHPPLKKLDSRGPHPPSHEAGGAAKGTTEEELLELRQGELFGGAAYAKRKELLGAVPRNEHCQEICFDFQTGNCSRSDCPRAHQLWPLAKWNAQWHLHFIMQGGHREEEEGVPLARVLSLASEGQKQQLIQLQGEPRRRLAVHILQSKLSNLAHATDEPLAYGPVQEGNTTLHKNLLWSAEAGGIPSCPSLMECKAIYRAMVGNPDAVLSGLVFDAGQAIRLPNGKEWDNCCGFKGIAAMLTHTTKLSGAIPELSADFVLARQFIDSVLEIPIEFVYDSPNSELADLYIGVSKLLTDGLPDAALKLGDPEVIRDRHVCQIGRDPVTGVIHVNLSCVGVNVSKTGVFNYNAENWRHLWRPDGKGKRFSQSAQSASVIFTITDGPEAEWRHCAGFQVDKSYSFNETIAKLAKLAKDGKAKVSLSERGCPFRLTHRAAHGRVKGWHSRQKDILAAQKQLQTLAQEAHEDPPEAEALGPDHRAKGCQPGQDEDLVLHPGEVSAPRPASQADEQAGLKAQWNKEHDEWLVADKLTVPEGSDSRVEFFRKVYVPKLKKLREGSRVKEGVHYASRFFGAWLLTLLKSMTPGEAKDEMVEVWRRSCFEGKASGGLRVNQPRGAELLKAGLSDEHLALLTEFAEKGADPIFIDLRPKGLPWPQNQLDGLEAERLVHISQLDDAIALKQMVFDFTEDAQIWEALHSEGMLEEAGLAMSSLVMAGKTNPDGSPKMVGSPPEQAQRICVNGSIPGGFNEGITTGDHTRQKTTSAARVALKACMEEKKAPQHQTRITKLDLKAAFTVLGHVARRVGLFCYCAAEYLSICLVMIFGSKSSPGLFEPVGDAVLQCLVADSRPADATEGQAVGETHPEIARFVDDLASLIGMFGNRCGDHMHRLQGIVQELLGPEGVSLDKMEDEGAPTNFKHVFGVVIDMTRRLMGAPWGKLVKVHGLVGAFVEGRAPAPSAEDALSLRGLLQYALECAPGMGRWVLPRLNTADADITRHRLKDPAGWRSYRPSFALQGETRTQGEEMLRRGLSLILRLAAIQRGKLLQCSFEAILPPHVRMTCPGKETPEAFADFIMDASGEKLYAICLEDGAQLQYEFSEAEQTLFNNFAEGEHGVTINHRELLTELFIAVKMGPQHAGKLLNMINDNTAAEGWTRSSKHDHARVDQVLSVIGVFETLFKFRCWGSRVTSKDNFADLPTRSELQGQYVKELAKLEEKHGWQASWVELDSDTVELGWGQMHQQLPEQDWFEYASQALRRTEEEHPGLARATCGVDTSEVIEALEAAGRRQPLPDVFVADGDFVEKDKSRERLTLTEEKVLTENILQRKLARLQEKWGKAEGSRTFNQSLNRAADDDPQESIISELQRTFDRTWDLLGTLNRDYDPSKSRSDPPRGKVSPLMLGEEFRAVKGTPLGLLTGFSGIGAVDTALSDTGWGELLGHAERNPVLRQFLQEKHPRALAFESVADLWHSDIQGSLISLGPLCTQHATSNRFKAGNQAAYGGKEFQECGSLIEAKQPAAGHVECTTGVLDSTDGTPSPLQVLVDSAPSYWVQHVILAAGNTVSPLTGLVAPLAHKRVHVFLWRKADFPKPPQPHIPQLEGRPPVAKDAEDEVHEAKEYRKMPDTDIASLCFREQARISEHGASYASIFQPEGGRGNKQFTNVVEDWQLGPMSVATSEAGSKWGPRALNGKAEVTMRRNAEIARGYLVADRQLKGSSLLEDRSRVGQGALGSTIPMNVADAVACALVREVLRVQEDGATAHEKWLAGKKLPTAKGKRKPVDLTPQMESRVMLTLQGVMESGKKPATLKAYNAGFDHWRQVAESKGWGVWLDEIENLEERQRRILWWLAYEKSEHNLKARSLRAKKSGVRWKHIANLRADPFEECKTVDAWLSNLEKMDGPAHPKIPVVITMLKMIFVLLDQSNYDHKSLKGALVTGYWFCLRSIEYLAEDSGVFDPDRSLVWGDITGRDENGRVLDMQEWCQHMSEMSLRLFSGKNTLETCTRTVYENVGDGQEAQKQLDSLQTLLGDGVEFSCGELEELVCVCPVRAIKSLLKAHLAEKRSLPRPEDAVFSKADGSVWTRGEVSEWLKKAAEICKVPGARVASHSLRRGGASAYVAAGLSDEHIERFGRWTSAAYKAYVFQHAEAIKEALLAAAVQVPRFEMN